MKISWVADPLIPFLPEWEPNLYLKQAFLRLMVTICYQWKMASQLAWIWTERNHKIHPESNGG